MHSGTIFNSNTLLCLNSRCQFFASMSCTETGRYSSDLFLKADDSILKHQAKDIDDHWWFFFHILWSNMTQRHPILAISWVVLWHLFTHLGKAHEPPDALFRYFISWSLHTSGEPTVTSWNIFCGEVPGPNSAWNTSFWISYHVINMFHVALIRIDKVHSFFTK